MGRCPRGVWVFPRDEEKLASYLHFFWRETPQTARGDTRRPTAYAREPSPDFWARPISPEGWPCRSTGRLALPRRSRDDARMTFLEDRRRKRSQDPLVAL